MRAHTRKHPTKSESQTQEDEKVLSVDECFKEAFGDFPRWAIALGGLRYRDCLTQKELAKLIEVQQSHISEMERGLRPIGKTIAKRLAKVFKTDYRKFL